MAKILDYWRLTKPRVTFAIFLLFILAVLAGAGSSSLYEIQTWKLSLGSIIVLASVAGSNALNNRFDSDIDKKMNRTKRREIPSGKISLFDAQTFGFAIITLSIFLALVLNYYFLLFLIIGLTSYLLLYTMTLKRRNILNVFSTGPAIASPVWIGWIIGNGYFDLTGLLTGTLVMIWGPLHLWSLAAVYSEDYRKASIPMLTSIISPKKSDWFLFLIAIFMSAASFSLYFLGYYGIIYFLGLILTNCVLLIITAINTINPSGRYNWFRYKFSAPYMVLVLLFAALDRIFT
ncbi:UbiA family prenyltransferase [[Eubacterium] cellulosolvens]